MTGPDLSKLTGEQRALVDRIQSDGIITPEERLEMEKAGIAKELIDELTGPPEQVGDIYNSNSKDNKQEFYDYMQEGRDKSKRLKDEYRKEVKDAWKNRDYLTVLKCSFEGAAVPNNMNVNQAGFGKVTALLGGTLIFLLSSCVQKAEPDIFEYNNETNYNINITIETKYEELKEALEKLEGTLDAGIKAIISELLGLGESLANIIERMESFGRTQDEILELLSNGHSEIKQLLENILNAVETGDENTNNILTQLLNKIVNLENNNTDVVDLLNKIFTYIQESVNNNNEMDEKTYELLETLVNSIQEGNMQNAEFYSMILDKLSGFEDIVKEYLNNILEAVNANCGISEDIRNLTQKVLEQINNHAVANNDALKAILKAISNIKVEGGNVDLSTVEKMLAELLDQSKSNGELLSSIDGKLDVINMTIEAATDKITNLLGDKFDQNNQYFQEIINTIKGLGDLGYDDTALLEKLDTILNVLNNIKDDTDKTDLLSKLDEILAAIKDHKVVVDVTGKVTCECNCGDSGSHEGIVGDLSDLLG